MLRGDYWEDSEGLLDFVLLNIIVVVSGQIVFSTSIINMTAVR